MVTIFLCVWIALHPNVPSPDESYMTITLRRSKLMVLAFITPELVAVWAMRQWLVSRRLAEKYQGGCCFPFNFRRFP